MVRHKMGTLKHAGTIRANRPTGACLRQLLSRLSLAYASAATTLPTTATTTTAASIAWRP